MTPRALFDAALVAARDWHALLPATSAFCDWPTDLEFRHIAPQVLPATHLIRTTPGDASPASAPLLGALQALAPFLEWRHTDSEAEVGRHFLDHFGWFELAGPTGHFHTKEARITVGYWGAGLHYARHQHDAEELYSIISGAALFHADGEADATLGPDATRYHASNQPHALTTTHSPILTLVFWRGQGLADPPRMSLDEAEA